MTNPTPAQIKAAKNAIAFTKAIFEEYWPNCLDIDGATMQELGEKCGVLIKTKYDPKIHGESEYDLIPGDDWFNLDPALTAAAQVGNRRQAFYDQAGTGAAAEVGETNTRELTHEEWCHLSRLFNRSANLGMQLDYYINEWLKERISWAAIRKLKDET